MMDARTLVLATANPGKIAEFRAILRSIIDLDRVVVTTARELGAAAPDVEECGATFAENAKIKALAYAAATGFPALADDSGLCVDALGGASGVYSARWAGDVKTDSDRTALLLDRIAQESADMKSARFICAAAFTAPDMPVSVSEGICEGVITDAPRGANGFGYDSIFFLPTHGRTMAELLPEEKNVVSHRALALQKLAPDFYSLGFPKSTERQKVWLPPEPGIC